MNIGLFYHAYRALLSCIQGSFVMYAWHSRAPAEGLEVPFAHTLHPIAPPLPHMPGGQGVQSESFAVPVMSN